MQDVDRKPYKQSRVVMSDYVPMDIDCENEVTGCSVTRLQRRHESGESREQVTLPEPRG